MTTPYVGFGNDTLAKLPALKHGDTITCPQCKGQHVVEDSKPPMILSYKCGDQTYMAGIKGRSTIGVPVDVSGTIP